MEEEGFGRAVDGHPDLGADSGIPDHGEASFFGFAEVAGTEEVGGVAGDIKEHQDAFGFGIFGDGFAVGGGDAVSPGLPGGVDPVGMADEPEVGDRERRGAFVDLLGGRGRTNEVQVEVEGEFGVLAGDKEVDLAHEGGVFSEEDFGVDERFLHEMEVDFADKAFDAVFGVEESGVALDLGGLGGKEAGPGGAGGVLPGVAGEDAVVSVGEAEVTVIGHRDIGLDAGGLEEGHLVEFIHRRVVVNARRGGESDRIGADRSDRLAGRVAIDVARCTHAA